MLLWLIGLQRSMKVLKLKTKKYSFYFFLQPVFLALVSWLVLIFVLPLDFNKYRAEIVDAWNGILGGFVNC